MVAALTVMSHAGLPLPSRIMAVQYKLFDRMRHPRAFDVARKEGTAQDFEGFRGARQALVVTFKRSGEPIPTPVNFGLSDDGKLYFRSEPHVAKIKRIRRDSHVRVCPCNLRGKPLGPMVEASARVLPESENERCHTIVKANWRFDTNLIERGYDRIGVPEVYVEVTPLEVTVTSKDVH
jgi:PPOX class probable F420-dependent enzyme